MQENLITLLTIAVAFIKLGQGFELDVKEAFFAQNRANILKALFVGVFLVPVLITIIILLVQPSLEIALVLIVMAVCPAADLSIQQVKNLGGDAALATGVQAISALVSIVTIPLFLQLFEFTIGALVRIAFTHLIREIAVAQFIPMIAGISLRKILPNLAWFAKYIHSGALLLLVFSFIVLIIFNYQAFFEFTWESYVLVILS